MDWQDSLNWRCHFVHLAHSCHLAVLTDIAVLSRLILREGSKQVLAFKASPASHLSWVRHDQVTFLKGEEGSFKKP